MHLIDRIKVIVVHSDAIAHGGIAAALQRYVDLDARGSGDTGDCEFRDQRKAYRGAAPRIVIVASDDGDWAIRRALELGAGGYVVSDCGLDELAEAVRAAHRGARHQSPRVAACLAERMALESLPPSRREVPLRRDAVTA